MPDLVGLDLEGGADFVRALVEVWEAGRAAAVLDRRLGSRARQAQLEALRPSRILSSGGGLVTLEGGIPVEEGDALVLTTSGSTGRARGVVLTHHALRASALATTARLGMDPGRHHWLACLPLAHVGGLSVVTRALLTSTPLTVTDGFEAAAVERLGREGTCTHVSLVPAALRRIDGSVFERILLGGSAAPGGRAANVVATYGMTETGSGVVYDGWPLEGVELAIGTGGPGQGAEGEILVRAPMLLRCYRDGADPRIAGPDRAGGWLATGDGGRLLADGRLTVHGRLAEVIVTGGEKVWPAAVEQLLAGHRKVGEVAVWKRPDPEWGERVVAYVVPAEPGSPPALEELAELVRSELAPWAAPKELVEVRALPKTASGKVRRGALGARSPAGGKRSR